MKIVAGCFLIVVFALAAHPTSIPAAITGPTTDSNGFSVYNVQSAYQSGTTKIRVLYPSNYDPARDYPVVYTLPVEAGLATVYGDGLLEVKNRNLQNQYSAIFVSPTFFDLPWYADHPTNSLIRQESYLLNVVVPFVDQNLPVQADAAGRLLLGFSKSGWGAYSLLLRHPDIFGKAAAWDAPMSMQQIGLYDDTPIFGTQQNFEQYRITDLLTARASLLQGDETRLILTGYGNFRSQMQPIDQQMTNLGIPHVFRDGPFRDHIWESGWVPEAVQLLMVPEPTTGLLCLSGAVLLTFALRCKKRRHARGA
jgi:S-formylglutathione hydrolase FrmB